MKLRIEADGQEYLLDLRRNRTLTEYEISGALSTAGRVSIEDVAPGIISVLEDNRSFLVRLVENTDFVEAWVKDRCFRLSISDPRDSSGHSKSPTRAGRQEVRASMPGKVVKVLISRGDEVQEGTGLVIVEAMKMQNELRSPKNGRIVHINVVEGAAVAAGEALVVVE
jgi:acetyl/propionyl-CoA carboxylase alpha subunit